MLICTLNEVYIHFQDSLWIVPFLFYLRGHDASTGDAVKLFQSSFVDRYSCFEFSQNVLKALLENNPDQKCRRSDLEDCETV